MFIKQVPVFLSVPLMFLKQVPMVLKVPGMFLQQVYVVLSVLLMFPIGHQLFHEYSVIGREMFTECS